MFSLGGRLSPRIPSFSPKRASDERDEAPRWLPFPSGFQAASLSRGSVAAGHKGGGGAFRGTASACHLMCGADAGVCLFLAGWKRFAPGLTVTNGGVGRMLP